MRHDSSYSQYCFLGFFCSRHFIPNLVIIILSHATWRTPQDHINPRTSHAIGEVIWACIEQQVCTGDSGGTNGRKRATGTSKRHLLSLFPHLALPISSSPHPMPVLHFTALEKGKRKPDKSPLAPWTLGFSSFPLIDRLDRGMHQKMGYDWEQSSGGGVVGAPPTHRAPQAQDGPVGKPSKRSRRLPEGHFDPDELCRRLYMVLADQKAHADRKRRARAEASSPSSSSAPRTGATTIITNVNINNTNISNSTTNNHNINTSSTCQRGDDPRQRSHNGRRPESFPAPSQPLQPANTSIDFITELRRRSSAKHKPSRHGLLDADPNVNGIISEDQYHPSEYHHVPKEAAKQFARTTTVDIMRAKESESFVHQLSKRALRFHKQGRREATEPVVPSELNRALRHSQTQRENVLGRNQFQRTRVMEAAAQLDHEREREESFLNSSNRPHTFERELSRILPERRNSQLQNNRRNSTGNTEVFDRAPGGIDDPTRRSVILMDPLLDGDEDATPPEEQPQRVLAHEHRVDWSQSDESGRRPKLLLSPLLRKADSLWGLRSRLTNKGSASSSGGVAPTIHERVSRGGSQESVTAVTPAAPSVTTPKSPKSSFFAKFKR